MPSKTSKKSTSLKLRNGKLLNMNHQMILHFILNMIAHQSHLMILIQMSPNIIATHHPMMKVKIN